ncbi:MAG: phage portal protein [Clostridiales bacterium]|nr:phage portal protein [Clostridiales bacterium]
MTQNQFFEAEIAKWKASEARKSQIIGERYYKGEQEILERPRQAIDECGKLQTVDNLPNNHVVDNQYANMVDQKTNYLLGQPLTISVGDKTKENEADKTYETELQSILNKRFHRTLNNLGMDSLNGAVGWLHPYYDKSLELRFKRFAPYECLPFWRDSEHSELDCLLRHYEVQGWEGNSEITVEKVEIYWPDRVDRFEVNNGVLSQDPDNPSGPHVTLQGEDGEQGYGWGRVPIIAWKYNSKEIPLINKVKCLQDAINLMLSDILNAMQEDPGNAILVIRNYDGEDLGQFRRNLTAYRAVKVSSQDGVEGGVETLSIAVNAQNYELILKLLKRALVENAKGYDAKDDRLGGNPNQMNLQSMYNDIDLDANKMETEFQASFEELLWFINIHLQNVGKGDFSSIEVEIIFNRDMLMNESEIMKMLQGSGVRISNETLIAQVPFISDIRGELDRLEAEDKAASENYSGAFGQKGDGEGGNI